LYTPKLQYIASSYLSLQFPTVPVGPTANVWTVKASAVLVSMEATVFVAQTTATVLEAPQRKLRPAPVGRPANAARAVEEPTALVGTIASVLQPQGPAPVEYRVLALSLVVVKEPTVPVDPTASALLAPAPVEYRVLALSLVVVQEPTVPVDPTASALLEPALVLNKAYPGLIYMDSGISVDTVTFLFWSLL